MKVRHVSALVSIVCSFGLVSPAAAEWTTPYDPLWGTQPGQVDFFDIDETSVTDPTPLFGSPTRFANNVLFYPVNFTSESANGDSDTTQGKLRLRVRAYPGTYLENVVITEYGDYLLTGGGGEGTQANIGGTLQLIDESPEHLFPTIIQVPLEVTPTAPFSLPGDTSGGYQATAEIDLTGYEWTQMYMILTNTLQTTSEDLGESGTTAFIEKNVLNAPAVSVVVIPEPGCLGLLIFGAAVPAVSGLRHKRRS